MRIDRNCCLTPIGAQTCAGDLQPPVAPRPLRLRFVLAGIAMSACACAPLQNQQNVSAGVEVPAAWASRDDFGAAGTAGLAQWWQRFDDPILQQLVTQALQANTSVLSAQAALRQARALQDVAKAALWPALGGSVTAQHNTGGVDGASNRFSAGLDASWELDIFGANRSARDASTANAQASAASLGDVQVSIAAEVALDYISLRGAQTRLRIASDNLVSQQETLQLTDWRQRAGLVTALQVEQARAAVEQTRAQLPTLQTSIAQSQHALAVLIGQPPAALAMPLAAPQPVPQARDDFALGIPADTLRQRPDVRAAEFQVRAAWAHVAQADAARWPDLRLGGSVGASAATLAGLTNGAAVVSSLLASASVSLFDSGALSAQVRAQQAASDQASMAYRAAVLVALKEVEDALVAQHSDRERLQRLQAAALAAANASLMARQRFGSGLVDFQVVLETQRTQLNTQDSVASAFADVSSDQVRLYKALGGGWNADTTNE